MSDLRALAGLLDAPCLFCGYSGARYWQPKTHLERCPWYRVGGESERITLLPDAIHTLLTSLEAREVEHRMLKRSNTVLNERLGIAERERDVVLERFAERTADWNIALGRAEQAEAAVVDAKEWYSILAEGVAKFLNSSWSVEDLRDTLRALEGREEKPS